MNMFNKLREKTGKQFVKKYQNSGKLQFSDQDQQEEFNYLVNNGYSPEQAMDQIVRDAMLDVVQFDENAKFAYANQELGLTVDEAEAYSQNSNNPTPAMDSTGMTQSEQIEHMNQTMRDSAKMKLVQGFEGTANGTIGSAINNFTKGNWKTGLVDTAVVGMNAVDTLAMGNKNFGSQSEAIDGAVHAASSALLKSGNPYAMAAGAALEGANFLTKAGGQTVQGFDVDINSSGYGDLGHMESSSSRDFGAMIGLGGLNRDKMQAKLAKRNQQALMAMNAANIAEEQSFAQEARMNSIQNTIMNNQMALAGGLDTSLLGG